MVPKIGSIALGFIILFTLVTSNYFFAASKQRYTHRVLQTIEMKLILLCVWEERAVLGSVKAAIKFKFQI